MTSRWENLRQDFRVTQNHIYLDHAACGPVPEPVLKRVQAYYDSNAEQGDAAWPKWLKQREHVRERVAAFLNADPAEIAFTHSTSHGMNLIAEMLASQGTVLTNELEFPSSTLPWIWRKAALIFQKEQEGSIPPGVLQQHLDPSIKTILTSFVQYSTGFRQDLEALGRMKGDRYLVVNATQGLGAFPIDVKACKIDFLCSNSYKWLLAGYGGGILYIRRELLSKFPPASIGWRSVADSDKMDNRGLDLRDDAARYELGCPSFPTIFAVGAAIEYLNGIGQDKIQQRILDLTAFAIRELTQNGLEVTSPSETEHRSGIVVFKAPNPKRLWQKLMENGIYVSPRGAGIRLSPHFYNTFEEIETVVKRVKEFL